jgi:hypothetical protein
MRRIISGKRVCTICKVSYSRKPRTTIEQWDKSRFCSIKCKSTAQKEENRGRKHAIETREKMRKSAKKGKESHLWRGGVTGHLRNLRNSVEYKLWRDAVYARDNWTCVWCNKRGCVLQADHIKPFAYFPELRFAIDNGRTLCVPCHLKTDTYGERAKQIYG